MILAISLSSPPSSASRPASVRPPSIICTYSLSVIADHLRRHELIRLLVGERELGERVRYAAELEQRVPGALHDGVALLLRHREFHEVLALVGEKLGAILGFHQRVEELVEVIADARALRVEHPRARDVFVLFRLFAHGGDETVPFRLCQLLSLIVLPVWTPLYSSESAMPSARHHSANTSGRLLILPGHPTFVDDVGVEVVFGRAAARASGSTRSSTTRSDADRGPAPCASRDASC